ncbi:MAG: IS200/IS605 family transposase [Acidobacteria bacterium]|nr:IS200/IS605 family transposase [Acidobacteriota bacterium]
MAHTCSNILFDAIFSTKDRKPLIKPDLKNNLFAYMGGIVRELRGKALLINGMADHVHMLVELPPALSVAELMRVVKNNSSRWLHESRPQHLWVAWQTGYAVFSVSRSNAPAVSRYIAEQEKHHRRRTFQEELLLFLKKHGIDCDERYIWS